MKQSRLRRVQSAAIVIGFSLLLSCAMAICSAAVQSFGPEQGVFGNMCGPRADENCMGPLLNGGFPFRYLFDLPGISVENQLAFVEDRFELQPFLLNWGVYFTLVLVVLFVLRRYLENVCISPLIEPLER